MGLYCKYNLIYQQMAQWEIVNSSKGGVFRLKPYSDVSEEIRWLFFPLISSQSTLLVAVSVCLPMDRVHSVSSEIIVIWPFSCVRVYVCGAVCAVLHVCDVCVWLSCV